MRVLALFCALVLSACAASPSSQSFSPGRPIECVPFARALTGVALRGDSPEWWRAAAGRYARTRLPEVGGILVFRRTARLPDGHVSVVSRIVSGREVLVTHANWVRGRVSLDQPVADVSPDNDWTLVRVWWEPAGQLGGTVYPAYGFILPGRRLTHEEIAAATPRAAEAASGVP